MHKTAKQMRRSGEVISQSLRDLHEGKRTGEYPALERMFDNRPDICTPDDCPHRQPRAGVDVFPSNSDIAIRAETKADLAIKSTDEIRRSYRQDLHNLQVLLTDQIKDAKESVHARLDRDVMPKIKKRNVFNTLVISGLLLAGAINLIVLYNYFT